MYTALSIDGQVLTSASSGVYIQIPSASFQVVDVDRVRSMCPMTQRFGMAIVPI